MKNFYPDEIIEEVRSSNDIVEVISQYIHLKKSGRNFFGICPFHNEKTPSFSVSPDKQIYHCFGCNEGGNVIRFLMKIENITFIEAVQMLAKRARIELPQDDISDELKKSNTIKELIYKVNKEAGRFYYKNLGEKSGEEAKKYLLNRGIDSKTITKFGLGYSKNEWDSLYKHLLSCGFPQDIIIKAGLVKKSKKDQYIDIFRNRVIFPIFDIYNNVIAFGGRSLDNSTPKYLNSPETLVFNKSKNLYALNIAKNTNSKRVVIVEGYLDAITLHQHGIDYAVASLGTALTDNQAKLLKKYCDEVVVSYDSDVAGQSATIRSVEILNNTGCSIKILQIPQSKDPDEYVRKHGIEKFIYLMDKAKTYFQFKIELVKKQHNLSSVDGKIKFLNTMSNVLANIDNNIERDAYIKILSDETGISSESIIAQINKKLYKDNNYKKPQKNNKYYLPEQKDISIGDKKLDNAERMLIYLICQKDNYKKYSDLIDLDIFSYEINKRIAELVFKRLSAGYNVEPADIISILHNGDEISTVSQIFSLQIEFEDVDKAIVECLNYIYKTNKYKEILKLSTSVDNDPSKINKLNALLNSGSICKKGGKTNE